MKTILILQNTIMAYRKPVYNGLAEDYEVTVLHSGPPSMEPEDRYSEIIVPQRRVGAFHLQHNLKLRQRMKGFDAVIAMFDLRWPGYLLPLYQKQRPKYILWGHWYGTNPLINAVRDHLMKRSDRLLMYGGEEIDRMIKRGIDPKKIITAPNTVHIPNHKDYGNTPKNSLLFVGRLQASSRRNSKRADILINIFSKLQGRISENIVVDIVGDGEEEEILKQLVTKLSISSKVIFHGHIDDHKILTKFFSKAIAYISPGHVGLSVLQSFAHGVPVLTGSAIRYGQETQHLHNVLTGQPVIIGPEFYNLCHGHNALLLETEKEMEQAIEKMCNNPKYATKLGRNAYAHYVSKRTLEHMLTGFREAIEN